MRNNAPIKNAGPAIIRDHDIIYHSNEFMNAFIINIAMYKNPANMKTIPPTISRFHDIMRTASKMSAGILCMNNPKTICQKLNPGEKTSNENIAKKQMNNIDKILGVQYMNLPTLPTFFTFRY